MNMDNFVYIFCEECGARLEVDIHDPRVFCDQCGTEVENVKYEPEETTTQRHTTPIFNVNIEGASPIKEYHEVYSEEYNQAPEEITDFFNGNYIGKIVQSAINNIPDLPELNGVKETISTAFSNPENIRVNKTISTTVRNNDQVIRRDFVVDDNNDVKEIFTDHEYIEDVREGTPVTYFAVVERRGKFFTGECPEVPFTSVNLADSFEECIEEIKDELEERVNSFGGKDYPQPSYEDLKYQYPQADIVEITVYKK